MPTSDSETLVLSILIDLLHSFESTMNISQNDNQFKVNTCKNVANEGETANGCDIYSRKGSLDEDNCVGEKSAKGNSSDHSKIEDQQLTEPELFVSQDIETKGTFIKALGLQSSPSSNETSETSQENDEDVHKAIARKETVHFSSPIASVHEYYLSQDSCGTTQSLDDISLPNEACSMETYDKVQTKETEKNARDRPILMTPAGDCTNSLLTARAESKPSTEIQDKNKQDLTETAMKEKSEKSHSVGMSILNDTSKDMGQMSMFNKLEMDSFSSEIETFAKVPIDLNSSPELFDAAIEFPSIQKASDDCLTVDSPSPTLECKPNKTDKDEMEIMIIDPILAEKVKMENVEVKELTGTDVIFSGTSGKVKQFEQKTTEEAVEEKQQVLELSHHDISDPEIQMGCNSSPDLFVNTDEEDLSSRDETQLESVTCISHKLSQTEQDVSDISISELSEDICDGKRKANSQDQLPCDAKKAKTEDIKHVKEQNSLKRSILTQDATEDICPQKQPRLSESSTCHAISKSAPKTLKCLAVEKMEDLKEKVVWESTPKKTGEETSTCNHADEKSKSVCENDDLVQSHFDRKISTTVVENINVECDSFKEVIQETNKETVDSQEVKENAIIRIFPLEKDVKKALSQEDEELKSSNHKADSYNLIHKTVADNGNMCNMQIKDSKQAYYIELKDEQKLDKSFISLLRIEVSEKVQDQSTEENKNDKKENLDVSQNHEKEHDNSAIIPMNQSKVDVSKKVEDQNTEITKNYTLEVLAINQNHEEEHDNSAMNLSKVEVSEKVEDQNIEITKNYTLEVLAINQNHEEDHNNSAMNQSKVEVLEKVEDQNMEMTKHDAIEVLDINQNHEEEHDNSAIDKKSKIKVSEKLEVQNTDIMNRYDTMEVIDIEPKHVEYHGKSAGLEEVNNQNTEIKRTDIKEVIDVNQMSSCGGKDKEVIDEAISTVLETDTKVSCDASFISATEYLSQSSQGSSTGFIYDQNKVQDCVCSSSDSSTVCFDKQCDTETMNNAGINAMDPELKTCMEVFAETDASYFSKGTTLTAEPNTDIDVDTDTLDALVSRAVDDLVTEDQITHEERIVDEVPDHHLAARVQADDPDSISLYDTHQECKSKFYSCDVDLCDETDHPLCSPVDKRDISDTRPRTGMCFKWTYAPSIGTDNTVPEPEEDNKTITIKPIQTCTKPIRLGLSKKRQPIHRLHKF